MIRSDNVGPSTFRALVTRFGGAEAALVALPHLAQRGGGRTIRIPSSSEADDEIDRIDKMGVRLVAITDPDYPPHLKHVAGPPPPLTVMGDTILASSKTVGIVGARIASAAGRRMAQMLAHDLGAGGALITELPLGWEPRARDFPRRNRLVAGISLGVVIVEAAKRSGSLITARLAVEQHREVFAGSGSPLDPRAEGGNHLIQQGAKLITSARDIVVELTHADPAPLPVFKTSEADDTHSVNHDPTDDERERLIEALSHAPTASDVLIEATGIAAGAMQIMLLELELAGRIERTGQLFALRG